jgi:alkylation response protein AidB-like acyl-CoA dehydrogenase
VRCNTADIELIRSETARVLATLDTEGAARRLLGETGNFDRPLWKIVADLGWLGISVPEPLGGLGMNLAARCVIAEELGRCLGSVPFGVSTCAMSAIARAGSTDQQAVLAEAINGGYIFAIALFEMGEAAIPRVCTTKFDGEYITGEKVAVVGGAFAQFALILCNGGDVVMASLDQPGVRRTLVDAVDNSRGYACLRFEGATGTALAREGVLNAMLDELAVVSAFEQVGGADACLAATRDYALQRHAFGQPIGAFQAVKHGLADFYVLIQIARGAALSALHAPPESSRVASACARVAATRAYDHCAQEAIQLHGGIGTTWEAAQHLHLRRSRCLAQEWGSASFWRDQLLNEAIGEGE